MGSAPRIPKRVLILGEDFPESVGESYRRTLAGHCDVRVVNPVRLPVPPGLLTPRAKAFITTGLSVASNAIRRDPNAWTFPGVVRAARDFQPDVIVVSYVTLLPASVIDALRRASPDAVVLGVFSDHIANLGRGYCFVADYDALFFKDHFMVDKFRAKLGWKHAWYLPQACDPTLHRPVALEPGDRERYGCDLTLAGNLHPFRAAQLAPLAGRSLRIWGTAPPDWLHHPIVQHHQRTYVSGDEKCRAMLSAKIVINNNHFAEISGTNKRTFEVAAMGAFQITDTPALSDVFEPDVEVASYSTLSDMLEKIDYYLERPDLREAMARRACIRAHKEHTFAHRWTAKMEVLGLGVPAGFPVQPADLSVRAG